MTGGERPPLYPRGGLWAEEPIQLLAEGTHPWGRLLLGNQSQPREAAGPYKGGGLSPEEPQPFPLFLPLHFLFLPAPRHINPFVPSNPVQAGGPRLKGWVKNCQSEGPTSSATSWEAHVTRPYSTHTWRPEGDSMDHAPPITFLRLSFPIQSPSLGHSVPSRLWNTHGSS